MIDEVIIQSLTDEVNFINKEVERTGNNLINLVVGMDAEVLVHTLNLIHRLQSENAGLKERGKIVINDLHKTIDKQKAEIEQLKEEHSVMEHNLDFHRNKKFELQKQVDELKNRFENKACCNMSENCSMVQKSVKDTAKEIFAELFYIASIHHSDIANILAWAKEKAKSCGVEVE